MAQMAEEQAAADAAVRAVQLQLRDIDDEMRSASGGGLTATIGHLLRR
jgi:hypothetical protein